MAYTSLPSFMDSANWHQQQQPNHQVANNSANSPLLIPPPQPQPTNPAPSQSHGGSIRPGSLADRARMANIPMQEQPQKCPRCDSTNTKFCYFNNYNLSQPRHFCKACKRYWTRGGALRNVPVGGGCRRNKRSKGSSSNNTGKSPAGSSDRQAGTTNSGSSADMAGLGSPTQPPLRFMAPLHQLGDHMGELGLNYGMISSQMGGGVGDLNFHIGNNSLGGGIGGGSGGGGSTSVLPIGGFEQWRMPQTHQFPFLSGLEAPNSSSHGLLLYPYGGGGGGSSEGGANSNDQAHGYGGGVPKVLTTSGMMSQFASVKMEDNQQNGLSRQFLGMINGNNNNNNNNNSNNNPNSEQYWNGGATSAWTDLSGFSSSSATSNQI